jgi:hypothetical protein
MLSSYHGVGQAPIERPSSKDSSVDKSDSTNYKKRTWIGYIMTWSGDGKLPICTPLPTASELCAEMEVNKTGDGAADRNLFVFRGVKKAYHEALQASRIDREFLAAHIVSPTVGGESGLLRDGETWTRLRTLSASPYSIIRKWSRSTLEYGNKTI